MNDYIIEHSLIPGWPDAYPTVHDRLDALDAAGLIHWPEKEEGVPQLKRYLASTKGNALCDVITDIPPLSAKSKEKKLAGYPTQKPVALMDRIILASSNPGDVVFDPFCGCATTLVAADRLRRRWFGIDEAPKAGELVNHRIRADQKELFEGVEICTDAPCRTDYEPELTKRQQDEYKKVLYEMQLGRCNGCDDELKPKHLQIDHIIPKKHKGTSHKWNLQLLCGNCNQIKGTKSNAEFMVIMYQKRAEKGRSWLDKLDE